MQFFNNIISTNDTIICIANDMNMGNCHILSVVLSFTLGTSHSLKYTIYDTIMNLVYKYFQYRPINGWSSMMSQNKLTLACQIWLS